MVTFIFSFLDQKYLFGKTGLKLAKILHVFFFNLLNLIIASFNFVKLVKIPENNLALPSFLLVNNIEQDDTPE